MLFLKLCFPKRIYVPKKTVIVNRIFFLCGLTVYFIMMLNGSHSELLGARAIDEYDNSRTHDVMKAINVDI